MIKDKGILLEQKKSECSISSATSRTLHCSFFFLTTSLCIQTTRVLYHVESSQCSQPLPIATFAQWVLTLTPKGKNPDGPAYVVALGFVSLRDSTLSPTLSGWKRDEYSPAYKSQRLRKNSILYHNYHHHMNWPCSPLQLHFVMKFLNHSRVFSA